MRNDNYLLGYTGEEVETALSRVIDGEFNGNRVVDTTISYASGTSGTIPPTDGWQSAIPTVGQGSYLWTRTVIEYTDGPSTSYSVAYQGEDGPIGPQGPTGASGINSALLFNTAGTSDTNGYTQAAVNGIVSNPNMLDNPYFEINQRGAAIYNTNNKYGPDRWLFLKNGDAFYDVASKTINCGDTGTYFTAIQKKEISISEVRNKYFTFSLKSQLVSGLLYMEIGYYRNNSFTTVASKTFRVAEVEYTLHTVSAIIPNNLLDTDILAVRFYTQTGGEIKLDWAKLEKGQVATAFTPPNIAEELLKCQRYYQIVKNMRVSCCLLQSNLIDFTIPLVATLRRTPTITLGEIAIQSISGTTVDGFTYTTYGDSLTSFTIRATKVAHGISNNASLVQTTNSPIALDAEL